MQPALAPAPHPLRAAPQQHNQNDGTSEQAMREHLLGSLGHHQISGYQHRPETEPPQHPHNHNIDPAIAASVMNQHSGGEGSGEGESPDRRGKRELSQSKRAAQNRAAQRAFRQRKESHIKTLENQVREYDTLSNSFKTVQSENYALRQYIIALQSDLLQKQGHFPPPPPHLDLAPNGRTPAPSNAPADPQRTQGPSQPQLQPQQHQSQPPREEIKDDEAKVSGQAPTASMQPFEQDLQSAAQAAAHQTRGDGVAPTQPPPNKRARTSDPPPNGLPQIPSRPSQ